MINWFKKGEHWIWFSASAVSISVVLVVGLVLMIAYKGLAHFWPHAVYEFNLNNQGSVEQVVGEIYDTKYKEVSYQDEAGIAHKAQVKQYLIKVGNRDIYGIDFRWISANDLVSQTLKKADNIFVLERYEWGNVYGKLNYIQINGHKYPVNAQNMTLVKKTLAKSQQLRGKIKHIEKMDIGSINYDLERLRLDKKKLRLTGSFTTDKQAEFAEQSQLLNKQFEQFQKQLTVLYSQRKALGEVVLTIAGGQKVHVQIKNIVKLWQPNEMSLLEELSFFFQSMGHFLIDDPREANTEGGIFPAIIGTITMVILMTIFVMPLGVVAAVYMSEYAKEGFLLRLVRISINNLAGVPSIVFGIFGLGFFVYILGGSIDDLFYSYAQPSPTFGTPGLLWASLTMALLTLPVVIVSTQEGLSRVPMSLREGGLALGATRSETIMKIVLPMSLPAIMTGLILAVARAAGEVAPLMLVGVVKLAPELPIDFNAPFVHLDRKFMHLGFQIYDVGFQSPNVEASQPLVYATALLLIVIIVSLNVGAIIIRNRLREKYKSLSH